MVAVFVAGVISVGCGAEPLAGGDGQSGAAAEEERDGEEWIVGKDVGLDERRGVIHDIYLGLSCPEPNSTKCDRVRIAVWLEKPAEVLRARVAGEEVGIGVDDTRCREPSYCKGSLQPAGLLEGPLPPEERGGYRWTGEPSVSTDVRIEGRLVDGHSITEKFEDVWLAAGWG